MAERSITSLHALNGRVKLAASLYVYSGSGCRAATTPPRAAVERLARAARFAGSLCAAGRGATRRSATSSTTLNRYLPAGPPRVAAPPVPRSRSWVESTLAGLIVLLAFGWSAVAAGLEWQTIAPGRVARLAVPTEGKAGFTLLSGPQTGIQFTNALDDRLVMENNNFMEGSGVALGDFDGDGWCDLYFCAIDGTNALYRNRGDWTFEDVTSHAGVGGGGWHSTGAVFADVDGDGDLDLVVNTLGRGTHCFLNLGNGGFREV